MEKDVNKLLNEEIGVEVYPVVEQEIESNSNSDFEEESFDYESKELAMVQKELVELSSDYRV